MKLSDEEQREKQLDNYKMMSPITGKSINELMGEEFYKDNYPDKDCRSKEIILRTLYEPMTGKQLYERIKLQGYNAKYKTFTGLLVRYQKAGFIKKLNNEKPIVYGLTEFSKENARNPKMLREQCIRRYYEFQIEKLKELIENDPEQFKAIYESIFGAQNSFVSVVGNSGSQYSSNDYGSKELKQELESKIYSSDFFKNADEGKLKTLVDGILNGSLSAEEREELLLDTLQEAIRSNKGSFVLNREYKSCKPEGERKYYQTLVNAVNKPVTKGVYEEIPFVFIFVPSKNELRLESESVAGKYRNNKDAIFIDFDLANQRFFHKNMQIKVNKNKNELEFYYVGINNSTGKIDISRKITTMSYKDYEKALNKSEKQSVKINVQKD